MRLYLGGYLDFYHPHKGNWLEVDVDQPVPLIEVIADLGIPVGDIHLVVVNNQLQNLDFIISENDEVKIYSAVGGG
jgi:sulfur carrier protein ThiS